jgi:hypothetical protein
MASVALAIFNSWCAAASRIGELLVGAFFMRRLGLFTQVSA